MKQKGFSFLDEVFFFLIFIYLFGCIGSYLQHVGSFIVPRELLSSCSARAAQRVGLSSFGTWALQCVGLVALWHVGS